MRIDEFDPEAAMIVRFVHVKLLKRLAAKMEEAEKEAATEEESTE